MEALKGLINSPHAHEGVHAMGTEVDTVVTTDMMFASFNEFATCRLEHPYDFEDPKNEAYDAELACDEYCRYLDSIKPDARAILFGMAFQRWEGKKLCQLVLAIEGLALSVSRREMKVYHQTFIKAALSRIEQVLHLGGKIEDVDAGVRVSLREMLETYPWLIENKERDHLEQLGVLEVRE